MRGYCGPHSNVAEEEQEWSAQEIVHGLGRWQWACKQAVSGAGMHLYMLWMMMGPRGPTSNTNTLSWCCCASLTALLMTPLRCSLQPATVAVGKAMPI